jgi:ACR3 family arsenite transporter
MSETKKIAFFEKYLSLWVLLCILAGIGLGQLMGEHIEVISKSEIYGVNIPIALLIWLMIYPMMAQIDFDSLRNIHRHLKGLGLTVSVNWLIAPFSMAFFAWIFFKYIYAAWISPEEAESYLAGAILLGVAPCTAMVFVWSYLSGGDPNYTLVQVAVNDLILLVAFVPLVQLLAGINGIGIPYDVLISSVIIFVVIPLIAGYLSNRILIKRYGTLWYKEKFLSFFKPVSVIALLSTLVLLFAYQGQQILNNPIHILLIAIPLSIQTYFTFFIGWIGARLLKLPHNIAAPAAMIGASNFFELAVAVAIVVFGTNSGAALATVVGVLIEVPIMLSLVALAKRWRY